jgi:hypothetical protein
MIKRFCLTMGRLIKQVCRVPKIIAHAGRERRFRAIRNQNEAERLDRICNPSKYRGKWCYPKAQGTWPDEPLWPEIRCLKKVGFYPIWWPRPLVHAQAGCRPAFVINSLSGTKKNLPARTKPNFVGPASPGEHFSSGVRRAFHFPENAGVGFYPIYKSRPVQDV